MSSPTDNDLLALRRSPEDTLVERKTVGDAKDLVKTIVAFANSTPDDRRAVLFVGVRDDGSIENRPDTDWDGLQRGLRRKMESVYPPIEYSARILSDDGCAFLAIVVPGSNDAPHFAGPAYVRVGSETLIASAAQRDRLIAQRNAKTSQILRYLNKPVQLQVVREERVELLGRIVSRQQVNIVSCDQFCVAVRDQYGAHKSIGLDRVSLLREPNWEQILILEVVGAA
jgi:predicted HTH transcriptional regulator